MRIKNLSKSAALVFLVLLITASIVFAAWTPEDFNSFDGSGFAPSPSAGQLDSDAWRVTGLSDGDGTFEGTHATGDFARGQHDGGAGTGGVYAFQVETDNYILGVQPTTDDFTPGTITLKVQNTTGNTLNAVYVEYEIWVYNDQNRANSLNFAYSTDDSTYYAVSALDFTTPETADSSPAWTSTSRSTTISGLNLAPGADFYLQWQGDDVSGSGARDEYGIDDVEVRADGPAAITLSGLSAHATSPTLLIASVLLGAVIVWRRKRA